MSSRRRPGSNWAPACAGVTNMKPAFLLVAFLSASAGAGAAEVRYFDVPKGSHPHDVAPAPDGTVWYTAQSQGAIGILDPRTGRTRQVALGTDSAPHGVI